MMSLREQERNFPKAPKGAPAEKNCVHLYENKIA